MPSNNPFSKGAGVGLTPAQVTLQKVAQQEAAQNQQFWFPIQQYFASQLESTEAGKTEKGVGEAAADARTQVGAMTDRTLKGDLAAGSEEGGGKYVMDLAKASESAAGATSTNEAMARAKGDQAYAQGLQEVIGASQRDQSAAMSGLTTAANEQAQEAGAAQQAMNQQAQGVAQIGGAAIGLLAA